MIRTAVLTLALLAISVSGFSQTAEPLISWATQFPILPDTPDNLAHQMAGGVAAGEYLYQAGGIAAASGAVDSDYVWRWQLDQATGALGPAIQEIALPTSDNFSYLFETVATDGKGIYISGGGYNFVGPNRNVVTYNTINPDGSLAGPWQTSAVFPNANGDTNPYDPELGGAVICENGYIYCFGGDGENVSRFNDCFYAQILSDGSLGAWQRGTDLPGTFWFPGCTTIGNYIIATGGYFNGTTRDTSTDKVWVCQVNTDGSMGAWVEQSNVLPARAYNLSFVAAGNTVFSIGGRNATDGGAMNWVWRAEFNPSTGTLGAWSSTSAQLPYGVRYHQASYSDYTHRIYVYSLRDTSTNLTNEVFISNPIIPFGPTPTPTATPLVTGTDNWNRYR